MIKVCVKKFKQKNLIIKKLGIDYKKIKNLEGNSLLICEDEENYLEYKKDLTYYNDLKNKVDYILMQMDKELSQIIYNEFFSNKVENWWMYYFSRSTYYRIKNKAMDNFLEWWYA